MPATATRAMQDTMKRLGFSRRVLKPWYTAFLICSFYAVLGGIWLFFSEPVLTSLTTSADELRRAKLISNWLFLVITAQILFLLIRQRELAFARSEETLHRVNRALRVFSECNKAITWERDEFELLRKICRILVVLGRYRLAWVGYASDDAEKSVRPVAHWGYEEGYLNGLKVSWSDDETGQGPAGSTIRTGQTTIVQHILSNPKFKPWRETAAAHGFGSAISMPLRNGSRTYGALVILAAEPDAFDLEEVSHLEELTDDLANGIKIIRSEGEQQRAKEEQLFLAKVIHQANEGILTFDREALVQYLNPAWEMICGVNAREMVGRSLHELACARHNAAFHEAVDTVIATGEAVSGIYLNQRENGAHYQIDAQISPVCSEQSAVVRYVAVIRDVTHEAELETQLRTAQKMEAIATLAGGIAHDFNNILAAIITNTELTLDDLPAASPLREHLEIVYQAGCRGKNLVKQIMTISRQDDQERRPVKVEAIVGECLKLLRASLPTTIEIRRQIDPDLGLVPADPTQLHQVILNLCTNAADAMAEGGILELRLEDITVISGQDEQRAGLHPGSYLKLAIRDTGHGMDRATLDRIFDPFFTTKGQGKGTGLGLSVAHSIIKSHGGLMTVESEPGQGTEFRIYLPRISCVEELPDADVSLVPAAGGERILFVDDEPDLVFAGRKMLEKLGYEVVTDTDSRTALALFMARPADFDLVITDQTMPHMTGEMLAREVLKIRDDVPVILCSGTGPAVSSGISLARAQAIGISEFLTKPYERGELSRVIRRLLDAPPASRKRPWPTS